MVTCVQTLMALVARTGEQFPGFAAPQCLHTQVVSDSQKRPEIAGIGSRDERSYPVAELNW